MEELYGVIFLAVFWGGIILIEKLYLNRNKRAVRNISYNNRDEKFEYIYTNLHNEDVRKIEKARKEIKRSKIIKHLAFIVVLIGLIYFYTKIEKLRYIDYSKYFIYYRDISELCSYGILLVIPLWFLSEIYKSKKRKQYEKHYKNTILSSFVKLYYKDFIYKSEFEEGFCYELKYDYLENEFARDYIDGVDLLVIQNSISGILENDTKMDLYDISLEKINSNKNNILADALFKEGYTTNSLFKGTYVTLNVGKYFPTIILISKNKFIPRKDRVELDSVEFEKYFDVNSDDKILTTRILTADVMQILVDFYKKYNIVFEIVFKETKICINFHTGQPFKIPIYTGIDKKKIYLYYAILEFTTNLSKEINKALNEIEL